MYTNQFESIRIGLVETFELKFQLNYLQIENISASRTSVNCINVGKSNLEAIEA